MSAEEQTTAEKDRPCVTWADVRAARLAAWEAETCPREDAPLPPGSSAGPERGQS